MSVKTRDLSRLKWPEVKTLIEEGLRLAIIPVGAFEQHGPHLPLRTDFALAYGRAMRVSERIDAVVVPVVMAGCSDHHLGFPGTISLRPETLIQILIDTARSLVISGLDRIVLMNGHGGNDVTLKYATQLIRRETGAEVVLFGVSDISAYFPEESKLNLDIHAGVMETAAMLIYSPDDVDVEEARKPEIQFESEEMQKWLENRTEDSMGFRVLRSRLFSIREFSSNGIITLLDPKAGSTAVDERQRVEDQFVEEVAAYVEKWLEIKED